MIEHKVSYCNHCQTSIVICGTCGNNCCNAGYGQVNGETCTDCPSAYEQQDKMWEEEAKLP